MKPLKCRKCGCNCDPGDLINGVCEDCREDESEEEEDGRNDQGIQGI